MNRSFRLSCACGRVRIFADGPPIASDECYCNSCRAAAARLQALPGAPAYLGALGGTRFVEYRKDRLDISDDSKVLKEFRLTDKSTTRRVVASCCNTPVFMEFRNGHWLGLYGHLWAAPSLPPLEFRTMVSDLSDSSTLPDDVPNAKTQPVSFYWRLLKAWVSMGFKTRAVPTHGVIRA
jgi:hypothetical protein